MAPARQEEELRLFISHGQWDTVLPMIGAVANCTATKAEQV